MDDAVKPPIPAAEDEQDADLPTGPIVLPPDDSPDAAPVPAAEDPPADTPEEIVPAAPPVVVAPVSTGVKLPEDGSQLSILKHRILALKEDGIEWFKTHKFLGGIFLFLMLGFLLYFWPIITCALVAQHMLKNTSGTVNKSQMYKIVAGLVIVSLSVQAIWIVQLAQAASFR